MDRAEFFGMAGISNVEGAYTPVSLGKGNKTRNGNRAWIESLRNANFRNADELRNLASETVSIKDVVVEGNVQKKYRAIVGDNTAKVYSIKSDRYIPVQHGLMVQSMAEVSDNTGISVFGRLVDEGGRMSMHAYFADPDCNVDFGGVGLARQADPYMLGVRAFNSHTGQTGFGAEIIGVRALCSNLVGFGDVLGKVGWKHYVKEDNVVDNIVKMVTGYMDKVPALRDRIVMMDQTELTLDEAECALWGIKVGPFKTEGIMAHLPELNPEIRGKNGKVSLYDVWNATTAYNTYSNTGGSDFNRMDFTNRASDLITANIDRVIQNGMEARQNYLEAQREGGIDLTGATVVGE